MADIPVTAISKVTGFAEATAFEDDDAFLLSQKQPAESVPPYISRHVLGSNINAHNDARYIRKIDVFFSEPLDLLIIQK